MFDAMIDALENELRVAVKTAVMGLVATARAHASAVAAEVFEERAKGLAEVVEERVKGLAEVAEERDKGLAEVDARRGELHREVAAMQMHQAAHEARVELNIGGFRFETSVQTLRRIPHTFFDAYFSGRYAQDVCSDSSIFVDRDGTHFGHVLGYMRDGVVSVAEPGARPSVSLLRALKREFGFYCIELSAEQPTEPRQPEVALVVGGFHAGNALASMERYDLLSGQWSVAAAMNTARCIFSACMLAGELYVVGGMSSHPGGPLSCVEKYTPSSDTWSTVAPLPSTVWHHAVVAVESVMYVLGGIASDDSTSSARVLKFESTLGTWSVVESMPEARRGHAACAIGSDIYVFGGFENKTSVFKFDTETNTWSTLEPMPLPCCNHSVCVLDDHQVYIVGAGEDCKDVLRFDAASGVWSTLGARSNTARVRATFVLGGCLYVAGVGNSSSSVERYDVATDTWTAVADILESRDTLCAVTIGSADSAEDQDLFDSLIARTARERM
jgi:hypothetical protein